MLRTGGRNPSIGDNPMMEKGGQWIWHWANGCDIGLGSAQKSGLEQIPQEQHDNNNSIREEYPLLELSSYGVRFRAIKEGVHLCFHKLLANYTRVITVNASSCKMVAYWETMVCGAP
ncbi:hypothetical protein L195_g010120 [Trifolium pratense]|uniref:Uncharacterized protein n=1 Tax=Trifolium pratense TaxID=57577 RepID=A0A2K3PDZ3_TRIPR|nr:hypothetical protein L195_g010120 [Trifolium pratense]